MLISVHMPKTGGLSFRSALEEHFAGGFRHDYEDYPLAEAVTVRREQARAWGEAARPAEYADVSCIHGHFLALKYLGLAEAIPCTFVTWMREPLARLVSHYDYWQRTYDQASPMTSTLHRRVIEEKWTLQAFCLSPELRNVYTEFLWGFPLERLDFIGITEFYDEDLRYFSTHLLGNRMQSRSLNRRMDHGQGGIDTLLDGEAVAQIRKYHAADLALYTQALLLREQRLNAAS